MKYAILRTAKIKSPAGLVRALKHDLRETTPAHADPEKRGENVLGDESVAQGMAKFRRLTEGVRMRKDSVVAIEYLVTASPEVMAEKSKAEQDRYLSDALKWVKKEHGAENVISFGVHRDEKTPHLHVVVVPVVQSKDRWGRVGKSLSAKNWLGGADKLSKMQDRFFEEVGQRHDLGRGLKGSKTPHRTIREYYRSVNAENKIELNYELPIASKNPFGKKPTPEEVEKVILAGVKPGVKRLQELASNNDMARNTLFYTKQQNNELRKQIEALEKALKERPIEEIQRDRELANAQKVQNQQRRERTQGQGW